MFDTYTRVTLKLLTSPPSRTTTKDLFINLRFNSVHEVESLVRRFHSRLEEREKLNVRKEPRRSSYDMTNYPASQYCHSLRAFSQF